MKNTGYTQMILNPSRERERAIKGHSYRTENLNGIRSLAVTAEAGNRGPMPSRRM